MADEPATHTDGLSPETNAPPSGSSNGTEVLQSGPGGVRPTGFASVFFAGRFPSSSVPTDLDSRLLGGTWKVDHF